jgi:hypothetical protein
MKQHVADALGEGRAAWLAREDDVTAACAESRRELRGLHRLPRSLSALEREEEAAHR